jgi:hypothetical protein
MKIERKAAVALFVALGLKNADKWNDQRMSTKLGKIKEMVDDDVHLEGEDDEILKLVLTAAEAGEEFEIEGTETPVAEPVVDSGEADEAKAAAKEAKNAEKAAEKAAAKEAKKAEKAAERAAKKAEQVKPKRKTTYFVCGEVIGRHGIKAGATKDMVKELTTALGKEDDQRFGIDLKTAWHAISGYTGFDGEALGVNNKMETRPKTAGKLYKEHGLVAQTKNLIPSLNEKYGKANDTQSTYTLRNSLGAILGYLSVTEGPQDEAPAAEPQEESPATDD